MGAIAATNAFLPLIERGTQKKVINISSAAGDSEFVDKFGHVTSVPYGVSKAALNLINTKYAVELRGKGYTFLAIHPGPVDTRGTRKSVLRRAPRVRLTSLLLSIVTVEEQTEWDAIVGILKAGDPDWSGVPLLPRESADLVLGVIDRATPEESGRFVSQYGDKRWL